MRRNGEVYFFGFEGERERPEEGRGRWGISPLEFYYRSSCVLDITRRYGINVILQGQWSVRRDDLIRPFNLCKGVAGGSEGAKAGASWRNFNLNTESR